MTNKVNNLWLIMIFFAIGCGKGTLTVPTPTQTSTAKDPEVTASPTPTPTPSSSPTPSASPTPSPTPTSTSCASFSGTIWDTTNTSAIVTEFNMKTNNFTELFGGLNCTRNMSQGSPFNGDTMSLVFSGGTGTGCGGVPEWLQFNTSTCNKLVVIFRDSQGSILETDTYSPK